MFRSNRNKGFQMTFANGNTVSVQWGPGNYCDNQTSSLDAIAIGESFAYPAQDSATAEIAAWDKDKVWHNFGSDEVRGWVSADEVAEFIAFVANNALNIEGA